MKIRPLYIIIAIALILVLWATCERKVENKVTQKEEAKVAVKEARIEANNQDVKVSQDCSAALAAHRKQDSIEFAKIIKQYEERLQQRAKRVRVPVTAPNSESVAELRKLSDYFQSSEWQRAVNNRTQ